jgi:predicted CXXCH cytochrome family protein
MKSMKLLFTFLFIATFATVSLGQITGSKHDFSTATWNTATGKQSTGKQICIICHTPHNSITTVTNAPLWNHRLSTSTYTPYASGGTMQSTPSAILGATSKLCLSCHDGTVGLEDFGGNTTGTNFISGNALVSNNLSNDHPISMLYNTALATADGGLKDPATALSGMGSTINADMLFTGQVECASCHDVHNNQYTYFLRKSNAASALCLTCHSK